MTNPTQSTQELRASIKACEDAHDLYDLALQLVDRLDAAEDEINEAKGSLGDCFDGIKSASLPEMIRSSGRAFHGIVAMHGEEEVKLKTRIDELEAAQVPRDMIDAPYANGSEIQAVTHLRRVDGLFEKLSGDDVWADGFDGWLPLPDQSGGEA